MPKKKIVFGSETFHTKKGSVNFRKKLNARGVKTSERKTKSGKYQVQYWKKKV
jgi:hypothetical protein